jgi:BioD-like phosphotransacetylase family protein
MLSPLPPHAIEELKKLSNDKDRDLNAQANFILSLSTNSPAELKDRQDMIASPYGLR